jgi:hypothetical protein
MKKSKKIPYTPKYKFGGFEKTIFTPDADDKQKMKKFGKQAGTAAYGVGEGLLDTVTMGATDQLTDQGYYALQKAGNSTQDEMREQDSIRGFGNAAGAIGGAIINPGATGTAISQTGKGLGAGVSKGNESKDWAQTAGMALNTAGQIGAMAYGQAGSPMSSGMQTQAGNFNASGFGQGLSKYNEFANQGGGSGQMGGMLNSIIGGFGGAGGTGGKNPYGYVTGGSGAGFKYGGQMKYAMGGMNKYPGGGMGEGNGQVELDENSIAPNGQFTQFNEPSHDVQNSNQPNASLAPGEKIFSAKLKIGNKTIADLNKANNTNREDKLLKDSTLGKTSALSLHLTKMAKMKNSDVLFAMQEQLKKDKVAAYAKKMGVEISPMDNQQMNPQGMPGQPQNAVAIGKHGGMMNYMAMGGVQLPFYNTDNAGNPMYAMGGKTPKSQERLNQEKLVNDYYDELSQNQFASMANLQGKRSGPDIWTPSMQMINSFRSNPNLDKLSDEKYKEITNQALSGVGFLRKKYEPYLHEDFTDVPKKYAMGGGYPAMTNPYHNFKGSIPMYQDGGNMPLDPPTSTGTIPVNRPLKVSELSSYGKTGYDEASMKNKDEKFELYNNPDYLIQNQNIDTGKWNDFQSFLGTYKLPTGENFVGNKAGNTKLANEYTNLALSDYNKSLSEKYKNNPDAIKRKSVGLGDIEEVQKYYNQGDPNVPVDRILGSKTTQFRYPHFSSVSQYKAKAGEFVPVTYGGKEYVVDAETYNNKIVPVSEGKSDENVTKYFQSYDPRKHQNLDEKNAEIVNRLGTMQGGSGSFTKKGLGKLPTFIYRAGQGTQEEQWKNYQKENNLSFKYGGQMPMPKFWNGGRFGKKDPNETSYYNEEGISQEEIDRMNNLPSDSSQSSWLTPKMMQKSSDLMIEESYPQLNNKVVVDNTSKPYMGNSNYISPEDEYNRDLAAANARVTQEVPGAGKPKWMDIVGKGVNFAAQNAGNIYDLSRKDAPLQSYERATGKFLDPTQARRDEQYAYRQANKAIPGLVGGSGAAAMNLLGANRAKTSTNIGRINKEYENANAQIGNQLNQYNTEIAYREAEARAKDAAMKENIRSQAIHGIGSSFGKATKSGKQDVMDEKTLAMYKEYYNNPQFRAALKKAGYDV